MSTPPLFHVAAEQLGNDTVVLDGREGWHAARVRRVAVGERVYLADGAGMWASCEVRSAKQDTLTCAVLDREQVQRPAPWLVVVQALAKGDSAERAVETMTEAGVDEIVPWQAQRCVVRWRGERADKSVQRWRTTAEQAAKQARRAWTPAITGVATTAELGRRVSDAALAAVLDADLGVPVGDLDVPATGEIVLVVGPEGGCADAELAALMAAGAGVASLGPTVLRSATAGTVAAAAVLSRTARWA